MNVFYSHVAVDERRHFSVVNHMRRPACRWTMGNGNYTNWT